MTDDQLMKMTEGIIKIAAKTQSGMCFASGAANMSTAPSVTA